MKAAEPTPEFENRSWDKWEPLYILADLAEGAWPQRGVRAAAEALTPAEEEDVKVMLLADLKTIFTKARKAAIATDTICHTLAAMDDRPSGSI